MKPKIKFKVYSIDRLNYGNGRVEETKHYQGTTYAVSEKKAIAQVKFRNGITPGSLSCYWAGDGGRETSFEAIRA